MPVGAIIGGVASIAGGILSSKAQKKAANKAATAATDNTAANNALAKDIYGQNKQTLAPFVNTGTNASSAINALLGLGGPAPQVGTQQNQALPRQNYLSGAIGGTGGYYNNGPMGYENMAGDMQYGGSMGYNPNDVMTTVNTAAPQVNQQQQYQKFTPQR